MLTAGQPVEQPISGNKRRIESLKIENLMNKTEKVCNMFSTLGGGGGGGGEKNLWTKLFIVLCLLEDFPIFYCYCLKYMYLYLSEHHFV